MFYYYLYSLPDITDIPTVTITELPLEILQPPVNSMDSVIIAGGDDGDSRTPDERSVNRTLDIIVDNQGDVQKGELLKIYLKTYTEKKVN